MMNLHEKLSFSVAQKPGWQVIHLSDNLTYGNNSTVDAGLWARGQFAFLLAAYMPGARNMRPARGFKFYN